MRGGEVPEKSAGENAVHCAMDGIFPYGLDFTMDRRQLHRPGA